MLRYQLTTSKNTTNQQPDIDYFFSLFSHEKVCDLSTISVREQLQKHATALPAARSMLSGPGKGQARAARLLSIWWQAAAVLLDPAGDVAHAGHAHRPLLHARHAEGRCCIYAYNF